MHEVPVYEIENYCRAIAQIKNKKNFIDSNPTGCDLAVLPNYSV